MNDYVKRLSILGSNHAERVSLKLKIASGIFAILGFTLIAFGLNINQMIIPFVGAGYFAVICGFISVICAAGAVHTEANNALFRDRDEMLSAIRVQEAQKKARLSRRDDSLEHGLDVRLRPASEL